MSDNVQSFICYAKDGGETIKDGSKVPGSGNYVVILMEKKHVAGGVALGRKRMS